MLIILLKNKLFRKLFKSKKINIKMRLRKKRNKDVRVTGCCCGTGCGSAIYGFGFIGSVIYYISTASGFWAGVLGILKAIVWPVFLVYNLMKFLGI